MFLPISVFTLSVFLAIFQLLLISALASILAIYSRFCGEYATSVRWAYHGGYKDMITSLFKSFVKVPISVSLVLMATIIASFISVTADLGATHFIHPAVRYGNGSVIFANTTQRCSSHLLCFGWSTWSYYDNNVSDAMAMVINSTHNTPSQAGGQIYKPRTTTYTPACNDYGLVLINRQDGNSYNRTFPLSAGNCGNITVGFNFPFELNDTNMITNNISQSRWSISMPVSFNPLDLVKYASDLVAFSLVVSGEECGFTYPPSMSENIIADGLRDFAKTYTRNCLQKNGELASLSHTFVPFQDCLLSPESRWTACKLDLATAMKDIFHGSEDDELFQSMAQSFSRSLQSNRDNAVDSLTKPIQHLEIRQNNSVVEILLCWRIEFLKGYICTYSIFNAITQGLENTLQLYNTSQYPPYTTYMNDRIDIAIDHVSLNESDRMISIPVLKSKTFDITDYMARLGWNLVLIDGKAFLVFDTTYPENGFETPDWLVILIGCIMACCACIWSLTNLLLSERFTSSLYKLITMETVPQKNATFPILVKARVEPFEVEGVPVLIESDICEMDADDAKKDEGLGVI